MQITSECLDCIQDMITVSYTLDCIIDLTAPFKVAAYTLVDSSIKYIYL